MAAILANPQYTGRQVWNRQRTDFDLVDPGNTGLGHRQVQRWNPPEGWVISKHPAHPALVSEADFIAAQDAAAPRGPTGPAARRYLLAGLLACGRCGRRLESAWSNDRPAYRCRHGQLVAVARRYRTETSLRSQATGEHETVQVTDPHDLRRILWGSITGSGLDGLPDTRRPEPVNIAEYRIRREQVLGGLTREDYIAA